MIIEYEYKDKIIYTLFGLIPLYWKRKVKKN